MTPVSLCKYVGSKVWLLAAHADRLPMPAAGGAVALPFVGAGSVAAHYGSRRVRVVASDINARLIEAHIAVRDDVEGVIGELEFIVRCWRSALSANSSDPDSAGRVFFEAERDKLNAGRGSAIARAARLLFAVRAGFNGLWRENKKGMCNVPYGKPKDSRDLVGAKTLREYAAAVAGVEFLHEDFEVTLATAQAGWVAYLDPPYSGTFVGYCGGQWADTPPALLGFGAFSDRERLVARLRSLDAMDVRWTLSDADTPTTRHLYAPWPRVVLSRKGTVSCDGDGRQDQPEILVSNWHHERTSA